MAPRRHRRRLRTSGPLFLHHGLDYGREGGSRTKRRFIGTNGLPDKRSDLVAVKALRISKTNTSELFAFPLQQAIRIVQVHAITEEKCHPVGITDHRDKCVRAALRWADGEDKSVVIIEDQLKNHGERKRKASIGTPANAP